MNKTTCYSKTELITLLKEWLLSGEQNIGNGLSITGNTKWIKLKLDSDSFYINADTERIGVEVFIKNHELGYQWQVITNNRNNYKKVTNDENGLAIKYLYFYADKAGQRII
jgi:hypothetical protein